MIPSWYPSPQYPLNGSFFAEQVLMLQNAGFTVGVLALDATKPWQKKAPVSMSKENGISTIRGSIVSVPHEKLPAEYPFIRMQARRFFELYEVTCGKPDLVHAHSVYPGVLIAQAASAYWDVPYCLTEHRPSSLERPPRSFRGKQIIYAVRSAQGRATVSSVFAEKLERFYSTTPWTVIALPVSNAAAQVRLPSYTKGDDIVFCHVSHLGENKRPRLTLRAFARMRATVGHARLRVIGGGVSGEVDSLRNYCVELGISNDVDFLGAQPRDQIFELLSGANAFVLASAVEAGGTVFAEAQMVGLPCVGTDTWAGQFMIEQQSGIVSPVDDEDALTEAMTQIARDLVNGSPRFSPLRIRQRAIERFSETTFATSSGKFYRDSLDCFRRHMS
ncbi:Glycosyltransferase involved in cell wall bisynthesis [Schaalia radingae]|uniref:Glycosyltransferase involved in cell wall bisynthesis n=2 Tax=Schaalia radingae TaxID=131110 RepID=A0ABY0V909_9ACTO|nr:Glycosyltransferase involved in cell wall bisynthesis [Schaalia radingae]